MNIFKKYIVLLCCFFFLSSISLAATNDNNTPTRQKLNILFIGSSGDQDLISYVPPILDEVLHDYDIIYGDMYTSGSQADDYVRYYKNNIPCTTFNLWTPDNRIWTRISSSDNLLENILSMYHWDIIMFKGAKSSNRQLKRIIQSLIDYPALYVTNARISRNYDGTWQEIMDGMVKSIMDNSIFSDYIPIATAIENARSNQYLRKAGSVTLTEPSEFTIPAGKYLSFYHKIRQKTKSIPAATIKATRLSGNGSVEIYTSNSATASTNLLFTLNDNFDHITSFDGGTTYIKIVNNGSDACTVKLEDSNSLGNYLLYQDNQHTQSGLAILIDGYTIALKILEWTGNSHRDIQGCSFIPTEENITKINAGRSSGNGLGHGYSCGITNYLGSDGNEYDRSELTEFKDTLYVTKTVFDNTPDVNSITAVANGINYKNIYVAQEVAKLAVKQPDKLTDCADMEIDFPEKSE